MIERVLTACEGGDPRELGSLLALLRRFDAEAAREEAREAAEQLFAPEIESRPVFAALGDGRFVSSPRVIVIDLEAIEAELAA